MILDKLATTTMSDLAMDPVKTANAIREADTSDVNMQSSLVLGQARLVQTVSTGKFYVFPFTVPTYSQASGDYLNFNFMSSTVQDTTANLYAGLIFGSPGIYDEGDRYFSQYFVSLSAVKSLVLAGTLNFELHPCAHASYSGTTAYAWVYQPGSAGTAATAFQVTASKATDANNTCQFVQWTNSANSQQVTVAAGEAAFLKISTAFDNARTISISASGVTSYGVGFGISGNTPGTASTTTYNTRMANEVVPVIFWNNDASTVTATLTLNVNVYTCNTAPVNMSGCPLVDWKYFRSDAVFEASLLDFALSVIALFGGAGVCGTGVTRCYFCTASFPRCTANNFPLPVCTSLYADYSICSETTTQQMSLARLNSQNLEVQTSGVKNTRTPSSQDPNYLRPTQDYIWWNSFTDGVDGTSCYRYPFSSASAVTPVVALVGALASVVALLF
jgi:hypothetical protein